MHLKLTPVVLTFVASAVLTAGCYAPPHGVYVQQPHPQQQVATQVQSAAPGLSWTPFGISVAGGVAFTDDQTFSDALLPGLMFDVGFSLWLSPVLALQANVGSATFGDPTGGEMTMMPVTAGGLFSLPVPTIYGTDFYRWRLGAGVGKALLDHSARTLDVSEIGIFYIRTGAEWVLASAYGGSGRIFTDIDFLIGDREYVNEDGGSMFWKLGSTAAFKVGVEFGF